MTRQKSDLLIPTFDDERHRYFVGSHEYPGVNRLLRQGGLVDESYFYEESQRQGKYTHTATALYDRNDLAGVERTRRRKSMPLAAIVEDIAHHVDANYAGSVISYARWVDAFAPEWYDDGIETPLAHPILRYCGTPDRFGLIRREEWNVEIKRGVAMPWHQVQVAGYVKLRKPRKRGGRWRRGLLYLHKSGKMATLVPVDRKPFDPVEADRIFNNCLDNFYWRLRNGDRSCFTDRSEGAPLADYGVREDQSDE